MAKQQYAAPNKLVTREAAEKLQQKLFLAAETALDQALADGKIQATLLSSCQSILRDSGLTPDLSEPTDGEEDGATAQWLLELSDDLG